MEPRVIKTKEDHEAALLEIERLMARHPALGSKDAERLELFAALVESYEKEHFPIEPPGPIEAISYRMQEQGLKQRDLVPYIGSKSKVSEVLAGRRSLSADMVRALHEGLGIPLKLLLQRVECPPKEIAQVDLARFPIREMVKRKWILATPEDIRVRPIELVRVFFEKLGNTGAVTALYRRTIHQRSGRSMDPYALYAWAARVLIQANAMGFSKTYVAGTVTERFMKEVAQLSASPRGPLMARDYLKKHGISLIIEPHLPRTRLDGGVMLAKTGNPVIGLSVRYDRVDNFWFTLLHELAHVFLHFGDATEVLFVDDLDMDAGNDSREREADRLAGKVLIPSPIWRRSRAYLHRTPEAVRDLARDLKIHPAVVAGRLRRETRNYQILGDMVGSGEVRNLFRDVTWN